MSFENISFVEEKEIILKGNTDKVSIYLSILYLLLDNFIIIIVVSLFEFEMGLIGFIILTPILLIQSKLSTNYLLTKNMLLIETKFLLFTNYSFIDLNRVVKTDERLDFFKYLYPTSLKSLRLYVKTSKKRDWGIDAKYFLVERINNYDELKENIDMYSKNKND